MNWIRDLWDGGTTPAQMLGFFLLMVVIGVGVTLANSPTKQSAPAPTFIVPTAVVDAPGNDRPIVEHWSAATTTPAEPTPTTEPTIAPTPVPLTAIGQDLKVGDVRWKVLSATDEGDALNAANEFSKPKTTAGKWLRLRVEVENESTETRHMSSESINVLDSQGRTYKASDEVYGYIPDADYCGYEQVNPNIPKTCELIYELPKDAAGLRAVVGDLIPLGATDGLIDLGQ